jgi:hypothetical protein
LDTIEATLNESVFFLIVGTGTEYQRVEKWFQNNKPKKCYVAIRAQTRL